MARSINRLNAVKLAKMLKPGYYPDGDNLYLQVSPTGTKSWIFRFTLDGKQYEMGLGSFTTYTLAEARERATENRKLLADGVNPLVLKREKKLTRRLADANIVTFDRAAADFIVAHSPGWRNVKHADQWRNTLDAYASPVLGTLPLSAINTAMVLRVLNPIWTTKTETASRLRGRIERILDWAKAQGYRSGDNPAAWRGHLDKVLPKPEKVAKVEHHPAIPWKEIGAFMQELRTVHNLSSLALQFIILTASRTSEVLNARWSEIDLDAALWTIPAERMKAEREHTVPLSQAALDVLEKVKAEAGAGEYVFPGRKGSGLSNMAALKLLQRMGRSDLTVHGFRSTFRDWCSEVTDYPNHVAEMALAHSIGDKTEASYRRGELLDKRRALMTDWAVYCATVRSTGDVIPIRERVAA